MRERVHPWAPCLALVWAVALTQVSLRVWASVWEGPRSAAASIARDTTSVSIEAERRVNGWLGKGKGDLELDGARLS